MKGSAEPKFKIGDKVFAKVRGYPPWPARVNAVADQTQNKMKYHVYFYGTGESGVVKTEEIFPYIQFKEKFGKSKKHKNFSEAMSQIESELSAEELASLEAASAGSGKPAESNDDSIISPKGLMTTGQLGKSETSKGSEGKPKSKEVKKKHEVQGKLEVPEEPKTEPAPSKEKEPEKMEVDPEPVPDKTSRSGRKIKVKKFLEQDENEHGGAISPKQRSGPPSKKQLREVPLLDVVTATYNDQVTDIPLTLNKPTKFVNPEDQQAWDWMVYDHAVFLKKQIERGYSFSKPVEDLMFQFTRERLSDYNKKGHCSGNQRELLVTETAVLRLDCQIRSALCFESPKPQSCIECLDEMASLPLNAFVIKKHPQILYTIKKATKYVGNEYGLSDEQRTEFRRVTNIVRMKAATIFSKLKALFIIPDGKKFASVFDEEVKKFKKLAEGLNNYELYQLTDVE